MENIKLELTIDEANTIINLLGQQPYVKVARLIHKIQEQGSTQVESENSKEPEVKEALENIKP
ncbi:MAG: hypothetical protein MI922_22890 [Bacteroidales bacterium]|nr:hypothetical protein [Bacteroidales bacterium]